MTRLFLIKEPEDCQIVNAFLENLERDNIEYEVKVKVSLNRKGLIFYSLGGEYEKSR